jgi:hypothetical protein
MADAADTETAASVACPEFFPNEAEQGQEQGPPERSAGCLQDDSRVLCDQTGECCFVVERRIIAQPTYTMPADARVHVLAEVIGNPSGMLQCQWKLADVVAETVNALEQRLQVGSTDWDSEDAADSTGACSSHCVSKILVNGFVLQGNLLQQGSTGVTSTPVVSQSCWMLRDCCASVLQL